MTQIISLATPRYVIQVSDRLVSAQRRKGSLLTPHDSKFNKHILFGARDAIVTIGFTGLAYLGEIPIDQWIAAILSGESPASPQGVGLRGMRLQTPPHGRVVSKNWPDIGMAVRRLQERLTNAFQGLLAVEKAAGLSLVIAGWQWKWKWSSIGGQMYRVRPILINLAYNKATRVFELNTAIRYWGWEKGGYGIKAIPALPRDIFADISSLLNSPPDNVLADGVVEEIFAEAIRKLSGMPQRGVGPDLLSVSLNIYREPTAHVRYLPIMPATNYYSAWIVTHNIVAPPQIISNSPGLTFTMRAGIFQIAFEGPSLPSNGTIYGSSSDQTREPPPS